MNCTTVGYDLAALTEGLRTLGLPSGRDALVHSSLRRIGPTPPGPRTLLAALRSVLGPGSTVVVPTHTTTNSTTSRTFRAATRGLSPARVADVEARIEAFDAESTRSSGMGALAEHLRRHPGAVRSGHPQASFAALGPGAGALMAVHDLDCHLGERSPLAGLYSAAAHIVLLGVGYEACTALHLAEYRLAGPAPMQHYRCYTARDGRRVRHDFIAPRLDDSDFATMGAALDREPFVCFGRVGHAPARAMPLRDAVDFAVAWLTEHRRR